MNTTRPTTSLLKRAGRAALSARRDTRAFTMIEALVAIGAMALVAVGIAAIFQSVGKTVSGGRRLSVLNSYAAMIEHHMRREFAHMTRDGFLVIRNQYADSRLPYGQLTSADVVSLSPTDPSPRPRRIDEVMFIAEGEYTSVREPLDPAYIATSQQARVYFGHGLRLPASAPQNSYSRPETSNDNKLAPRLGRKASNGGTGVNEYAKDWTLLRHATLLVRPETTQSTLPPNQVFAWKPTGPTQATLRDKEGQIALQPAASSLFRSISTLRPSNGVIPLNQFVRGNQQGYPVFASGIIDIACCDLSDVRGVINGMKAYSLRPAMFDNTNKKYEDYPPRQTGFPGWTFQPDASTGANSLLASTKEWMDDAWPAPSNQSINAPDAGGRIRYEPGPTNYIGTIDSAAAANGAQSAYRRADQLALSASNFIPGCTEFIVEYSFGVIDPGTSKVIWHGMNRQVDQDGDGAITTVAKDPYAVRPYPQVPGGGSNQEFKLEYRDQNGDLHSDDTSKNPKYPQSWSVPAALINDGVSPPSNLVQTWYFGYTDPTATAANEAGRPWAWPTMIRVTLSLTDPENPGVEETFQFVFPTPGNPT